MLNINNNLHNLGLYNTAYVTGWDGIYFNNSLFGALKFVAVLFQPGLVQDSTPQVFITGYTISILVALALLTAYVVLIEKKFWIKVTLLVCALNLFPYVSGDYKLLHLFIPLFLFINQAEPGRLDRLILILFGLLLIPKDYFHLSVLPEASVAVLLNPVLMLGLMAVVIASSCKAEKYKRGTGLSR